ncbi:MAG TPA: thioredoxin family protein, partial [Thermoanaerobaculia bacterium]|nr:thioredoxin family protein [Thermoanaerobaculia bacterium]
EISVVDPSGVIRYHGRIDENRDDPAAVRSPDLRNALDSILAGKSVAVPETKAFGCSIKRG